MPNDLKSNVSYVPPGKRVGPEPDDEADHFMVCGDCGQSFDMRDLGQVLYHAEAGHKPIPSN